MDDWGFNKANRYVTFALATMATGRSKQIPITGEETFDQIRSLAEAEAERILLACAWGEPGDDDPRTHMGMLVSWAASHILESAEGIHGVYGGTAEVESKAKAEYERLRRILNRAIDKSNVPLAVLSPGCTSFRPEVAQRAAAKVREDANRWHAEQTTQGTSTIGVANQLIYQLARLPDLHVVKLPAYGEWVAGFSPATLRARTRTGRAALVKELPDIPAFIKPVPFVARQMAAVSILVGVPTPAELVPTKRRPRSIADIIEAETRRILKLQGRRVDP